MLATVPDPDLQIREGGGGGGGHPDPEIGGWTPKKLFSNPRASVWSKNKEGTGPPEHLHWIRHCAITGRYLGFRCIQGEDPK